MKKSDIVHIIKSKTGIPQADVSLILEGFLTVIKNTVAQGDSIEIRGFGTFSKKKRSQKIARNLQNNTAIIIEEHYIPYFKPSKIFIEKVKNKS